MFPLEKCLFLTSSTLFWASGVASLLVVVACVSCCCLALSVLSIVLAVNSFSCLFCCCCSSAFSILGSATLLFLCVVGFPAVSCSVVVLLVVCLLLLLLLQILDCLGFIWINHLFNFCSCTRFWWCVGSGSGVLVALILTLSFLLLVSCGLWLSEWQVILLREFWVLAGQCCPRTTKSSQAHLPISAFLFENRVLVFHLLGRNRASIFWGLWPKNRQTTRKIVISANLFLAILALRCAPLNGYRNGPQLPSRMGPRCCTTSRANLYPFRGGTSTKGRLQRQPGKVGFGPAICVKVVATKGPFLSL